MMQDAGSGLGVWSLIKCRSQVRLSAATRHKRAEAGPPAATGVLIR